MYKHLSKKDFANEVLAETFGYYQDDFSEEVNFFEMLLEMHQKNDMGFNWIRCGSKVEDEYKYDEFLYSDFDFHMRVMDDMAQYYENHFVGDDDLEVISDIVGWAIDHQEDKKCVEEKFSEVLKCLLEKNVIVDVENGAVEKTMCEIVDSYFTTGIECRHPAQMPKKILDECICYCGKSYLGYEMELLSRWVVGREKSQYDYDSKDKTIKINFVNPLVDYRGRNWTLEKVSQVEGFSSDDYRVLIAYGFPPKRALEICLLETALQREMVSKWNTMLGVLVSKFIEVKKLEFKKTYKTYCATEAIIVEDSAHPRKIREKYRVGDVVGTVEFWARMKGVSTTWVKVRLRDGLSMKEIMERVMPCTSDWEKWKIQGPDMHHPNRKVVTIFDVMQKEKITKGEILQEIKIGRFGKRDILKIIKRIKLRRRRSEMIKPME